VGGACRLESGRRINPAPLLEHHRRAVRGKYRNASVLHDVAYEEQKVSPQEADLMFYNAMRCAGVGATTAKTMYYVLLRHGRHWKHRQAAPSDQPANRPTAVAPRDVDEIQKWIRANDPSLDEIQDRADDGGR
jgi:hypothetical protein